MKQRSWRVLVALQNAANRSKWISSTECALFVHTEARHWTSHIEAPMCASRPLYLASECKRMLRDSEFTLTKPTACIDFSVIGFQPVLSSCDVVQLANAQQSINKPCGIPNIGNTCFANALLQCCRQLLSRIPSHLLPKSQQCLLASAMQGDLFDKEDVKRWPCWTLLPIGPQRDASEVLEM